MRVVLMGVCVVTAFAATLVQDRSWQGRVAVKPSILNPAGALSGRCFPVVAALITGASGVAADMCADAHAGVLELAARGVAACSFGALAALDAKYRRVPLGLAIPGIASAALTHGTQSAAGALAIGFGCALVIWAASTLVWAFSGREAMAFGDVLLVWQAGATYGGDLGAWGAFLIGSTCVSAAALVFMKWRKDDEMVPLYALVLLPYLLGLVAGA